MSEQGLTAIQKLAAWSEWLPFAQAIKVAPTLPGVYVARQGEDGPPIYVGMAGERRGKGIRGRLTVYSRGKGMVSGLGEAALDRALADAEWLRERLREVDAGEAKRALDWGKAAVEHADIHVSWATTQDRAAARLLERQVLDALADDGLWNRAR